MFENWKQGQQASCHMAFRLVQGEIFFVLNSRGRIQSSLRFILKLFALFGLKREDYSVSCLYEENEFL